MPRPQHGARVSKEDMKVQSKNLSRLFRIVFKMYPFHLIAVVILIVLSSIANIQGTMFMQPLINDYILPMVRNHSTDFDPLLEAILKVARFYVIGIISTYIYNLLMVFVAQGTLKKLRNELFCHMEKLPIRYFDTHQHGDIMSVYTNDIDTLRQVLSQSFPQMISSAITVVMTLVSMFILNVPLTILTLLMVGLMFMVTGKIGSLSGKYFVEQQKAIGAVNANIEEMMNGQKVVKIFNHEEEAIEAFDKLNDEVFKASNKANGYANILMPANAQIGNVSYVLVAVVGGALALGNVGGFTLGGLAAFLTFNKSFNMPINQVSQQMNFIVMAMAGASRIFEVMDQEAETDEGYVTLVNAKEEDGDLVETEEHTGMWAWKHYHAADQTTTYMPLMGEVVFDDVDFGYNGSEDSLCWSDRSR